MLNIGLMNNMPTASMSANSPLTSEYDKYITYDAVDELMSDIIGEIRQDFTHVDRTWAEVRCDDE
jgi:hypothetical protein